MFGHKKLDSYIFIVVDFLAAILAWTLFYFLRKSSVLPDFTFAQLLSEEQYLFGIGIIPLAWICLYAFFGNYGDVYRFSRLNVLAGTLVSSFVGTLIIFFILLLDDQLNEQWTYYSSLLTLFTVHFFITAFFRMLYLTMVSRKLKNRKVSYNTLIIGGDSYAEELYKDLTQRRFSLGQNIIGFIDTNGNSQDKLSPSVPALGKIKDISQVIKDNNIEEVIIAIERNEKGEFDTIMDHLFSFDNVLIKIIPDIQDIIFGAVKMNHVFGAVLIEIERELMPKWQKITKRFIDIVCSIFAIIILLPVYLFVAIRVKLDSKGPIFYLQERIGIGEKPFNIIKYRSMRIDAEELGPQLSSDHDPRVTAWGRFIRKWRLDELPQFWNVLKGDMSLVGPRPERRYFIEQISARAPHYKQLLKVRPGITSWGQVKYGYASTVDEMIQRLKFDILYIENMSLSLDIKIIFYTLLVLIQGKGK